MYLTDICSSTNLTSVKKIRQKAYFKHSLGIESIFICGNDESQAKITKVHNFNFSQATKALIYNTRAGELPLTPKQIKKVIIYETFVQDIKLITSRPTYCDGVFVSNSCKKNQKEET